MKEIKSKYNIKEIYKDTYAITDNGFGQVNAYMYLLVGEKKALLVDSGYGLLDLRAIVGSITDKEVICACTHGHIDHALGAHKFEEAYLHSKDFDVYKYHSSPEFIGDMAEKGLLMRPSKRMRRNTGYQNLVRQMKQMDFPALKPLDDVPSFDLGGRTVSWRLVPGHTQGCVAFIDEKNSTAFDGDASAFGAWLFLPESVDLPLYANMLKEYAAFMEKRGISRRYVGHTGKPLGIKSLRSLARCAETAIAKPNKGFKVNTLFGGARIVFANGSLLFCRR